MGFPPSSSLFRRAEFEDDTMEDVAESPAVDTLPTPAPDTVPEPVPVSLPSGDAKPDVLALVEKLKEDIVDNRIPLIDGVAGLPEKMGGAFKDSLAKEESIDERYRTDLTRIRDYYVTRLKGGPPTKPPKTISRSACWRNRSGLRISTPGSACLRPSRSGWGGGVPALLPEVPRAIGTFTRKAGCHAGLSIQMAGWRSWAKSGKLSGKLSRTAHLR